MSSPDSEPTPVEQLQLARDGKADVHVWRSETHRGLLTHIVSVEPNQTLSPEQRNWLPDAFTYLLAPYYDGKIDPLEAAERLDSTRASLVVKKPLPPPSNEVINITT